MFINGEETGEEGGGEEITEDGEVGGGKVELGSGQTMSWQRGGQNSLIFSKRYCLLSLDNPSGVISGGISN